MELNKTKNWPYYALSFSIIFIMVLGGWWLYLVFTLAIKLKEMHSPILKGNLVMMVQWEGVTFLTLTIFVGLAILYVFFQDSKKSRATQLFYASLTHELKTPLASMRLQAQVLLDLISKLEFKEDDKIKVEKYSKRLEQDSVRLEDEIDRHLQLSRLEFTGNLNFEQIQLSKFIQDKAKSYDISIEVTPLETEVLADQAALTMIIKNLIENSLRHNKGLKKITITLEEKDRDVLLHYNDHGEKFNGDLKSLGKLFYKFNSPKGSGIGLYLINKLMQKQNGSMQITNSPNIKFHLSFPKVVHDS
jgi:signal transduction histidine kinase